MKIKYDTELLSNVVKRVSKGLVANKFLPYSNNIKISILKDMTYLAVSDGSNTYIHKINNVGTGTQESYSVNVNGQKFLMLVSKTTSKTVSLEIKGNKLIVTGNGRYTFDVDTESVPVKSYQELTEGYEIRQIILPHMGKFETAEAGLSKLVVNPTLMGYYISNNYLITTNGVKLSIVKCDLGTPEYDTDTQHSFYLTTRMVELLKTCENEEVRLQNIGQLNILITPTKLIYGPEQPGKAEYPDVVTFVDNLKYNKYFVLGREHMTSAVDRISIFDNSYIKIKVKDGVVSVLTDKENVEEVGNCGFTEEEYEGKFNVVELKDLISKQTGDVTFYFSTEDEPIKLETDSITQVLASVVEGI